MQPLETNILSQTADRIRTSLWFVPGLMALGAVALAILGSRIDESFCALLPSEVSLVFSGSPDSARTVLSTIATSSITIAGVAFSMTIVSLQLASSQFGPRLLRTFLRDRGNQIVLGGFVATFLYCVLVLAFADGPDSATEIPRISITIAVGLAVFALGLLVYFIDHVAQSIHADAVIDAVSRETTKVIDNLYPEEAEDVAELDDAARPDPESGAAVVRTSRPGFVHSISTDALVRAATDSDLVLEPLKMPGDYVFDGDVLIATTSSDELSEDLRSRLCRAFLLRPHRTTLQDPRFALEQLTEMATRALSPGTNDPTTAVNCIRGIGSGLARIVARPRPSPTRTDANDVVRLVLKPVSIESLARTSLEPIARNAGSHLTVWLGLLETLRVVVDRAARDEDRDHLRELAQRIAKRAAEQIVGDVERQRIQNAAAAIA